MCGSRLSTVAVQNRIVVSVHLAFGFIVHQSREPCEAALFARLAPPAQLIQFTLPQAIKRTRSNLILIQVISGFVLQKTSKGGCYPAWGSGVSWVTRFVIKDVLLIMLSYLRPLAIPMFQAFPDPRASLNIV